MGYDYYVTACFSTFIQTSGNKQSGYLEGRYWRRIPKNEPADELVISTNIHLFVITSIQYLHPDFLTTIFKS